MKSLGGVKVTIKEKAEKLHQKVKTFIISCVGADGYPLTKAVVPAKHRDSLDEIYFCTNTSSKFVKAISHNPKANVYFYNKIPKYEGCMLKGDMEIVSDMDVKLHYWDEKYKDAYHEKSASDPDFCVLKFTTASGRHYSSYQPKDFEI